MSQNNAILSERQAYFTDVNLNDDVVNCGDDRASDLGDYVHVFGGVLFVPYTLLVMQKINDAKGANSFMDLTRQTMPMLTARGAKKPGVHSDDKSEHGSLFDAQNHDGNVGCGYAGKREDISRLIGQSGHKIINECTELMPELFNQAGRDFAGQVVHVHGQLADDKPAIGSGRQVARAAAELGAQVAIFTGNHNATTGIVNTQPGTSFDTRKALQDGLATYDHDLWASAELLDKLEPEFTYDKTELAIASLIDVVGTMKALGVTDIARR